MRHIQRFIFGFLLLSLILPGAIVSAHKPIWGEENGIIEIPDLVTSYAFYRDLPSDKVDAYYFEGKAGQQFNFGVQIPDLASLQNYEVTVVLFGPGLPEADKSQLPPDHPEDLGALIFPSTSTEDFFEAFTQTNYLGRQKISTTLPADGDYYLIVWQPEGFAGKYVLDSGRAENFTPGDLFLFPIWWIQVRAYFGQGPALLAIASVILLAGITIVLRRRKK
jgi:hypothetical protein